MNNKFVKLIIIFTCMVMIAAGSYTAYTRHELAGAKNQNDIISAKLGLYKV